MMASTLPLLTLTLVAISIKYSGAASLHLKDHSSLSASEQTSANNTKSIHPVQKIEFETKNDYTAKDTDNYKAYSEGLKIPNKVDINSEDDELLDLPLEDWIDSEELDDANVEDLEQTAVQEDKTDDETVLSDDEYPGYDSDPGIDENQLQILDNPNKQNLKKLLISGRPTQGRLQNRREEESVVPYLDDAIADADDVKRGDQWLSVPGHPPVRVIDLNETIYLNESDDGKAPQFQPVRIPNRFEDYDVNGDNLISLPELRYVTGAIEGARDAFHDADHDGDGWVERREFQLSGWGVPVDLSMFPHNSKKELHP